jgi:DNA-binding response OmpR family regulator
MNNKCGNLQGNGQLAPGSGIVLSEQSLFLSSRPIEDDVHHRLQPRHVLVVEGEPSIRNLFYVLLAGLGCEGDIADTGRQALAMIAKESFYAVLLDLRCSEMPAGEMVAAIRELRPNLVGRVLVITGEVSDPQVMEMIEKNCWPCIPRQRIMQELWGRLRAILGLSQAPVDSTT